MTEMFMSHLPNNGIGEAALAHSLMYSQSANLVYRCSLERPWSYTGKEDSHVAYNINPLTPGSFCQN